MTPTRDDPAEPAVLQRMISEKLWEIRRAASARDDVSARRAERQMSGLLDQLADCMIADVVGEGWTTTPRPARAD